MVDFQGTMRCHIIFSGLFMQFFLEYPHNYTDLPSIYDGVGRSFRYNQTCAFQDPTLPWPPLPLVSCPSRVVSLFLEFEATY